MGFIRRGPSTRRNRANPSLSTISMSSPSKGMALVGLDTAEAAGARGMGGCAALEVSTAADAKARVPEAARRARGSGMVRSSFESNARG